MDALFAWLFRRPVPLSLAGAHFLPFALLAWVVILGRAVTGRFSRREWALFAVFAVCYALETVQLMAAGFGFLGDDTYGLPRYFGVLAPILWIWAAWSLASVWSAASGGWRTFLCRAAVVAAIAWIAISQNYGQVEPAYSRGAIPDVHVACSKAARIISRDYAGPERQEKPRRVLQEYYSSRRPVVFSDFGAVAWMLRGQSEGAQQSSGYCPYPDDYLFIRVGSGYGTIETVDARQYDYMGTVKGLGTEWRLFRRKTTPHR
ncbi:MAG: hypothetical protein J6U17_02245 [Kiritimatiellae bacterium]|nr:hypothetical protein [Kiritimatiellia bacterium]